MWYYAVDGNRLGPVGQDEFDAAVASGTIDDTTLVWREGMAEWQPWAAVRGGASSIPVSSLAASGGATATCAVCGGVFPTTEMLTYQNDHVCAMCKPVYFQQIKESGAPIGKVVYAGFWIRFVAKFIDGVISGLAGGLWQVLVMVIFPQEDPAAFEPIAFLLTIVGSLGIGIGYMVFFIGRYAGTPGKLALGLRVVRADGSPVTYGRATGRYFAEWLSYLTLYIGFIMAAFDDEKRSLHDRLADTRVVKVS